MSQYRVYALRSARIGPRRSGMPGTRSRRRRVALLRARSGKPGATCLKWRWVVDGRDFISRFCFVVHVFDHLDLKIWAELFIVL